jgi:GT2 family glycosyltransferase/glycosyltransferase involved in cell wall biosynthesis
MSKVSSNDVEAVRASGLFDAEWYLQTYPDVSALGMDPAEHYLWLGAELHRNPSPRFETGFYLTEYADVSESEVNPLLHYIRIGAREGRSATLSGHAQPSPADQRSETAPRSDNAGATIEEVDPKSIYTSSFDAKRPYVHPPSDHLRNLLDVYHLERLSAAPDRSRIAIFTAIAGDFEVQKFPEHLIGECDYFLFVDQPVPDVGLFNLRPTEFVSPDPRRTARFVKTHPHHLLSGYDIAVWIDSNIIVRGAALASMIAEFQASDFPVASVPHPWRSSVYEEAAECIRRKLDDETTISAQMGRYHAEGFDSDGLIETNLMMYDLRHPKVPQFLNAWWREIDCGSRRDQLSVNFAMHEAGIDCMRLTKKPDSVRNHPEFAILTHSPRAGNTSECIASLSKGLIDPFKGLSYAMVRDEHIRRHKELPIDVIVCVHNALEDVRLCLHSIDRAKTGSNQRIILIDDGSDRETGSFLARFARNRSDVLLHRNEQATGYSRAANQGLKLSTAEFVILLNSDTVVTDGWAEKLADALFCSPGAGIVGPMSNAASHQSIPEHRSGKDQTAINELPAGTTAEDMNRHCERWTASHALPRTPLVHGFCFGIARAVINAIGYFDVERFPRGYGEENDFCIRASEAGFGLVVATHTYVFHAKSKSYTGANRVALMDAGGRTLRDLYGSPRIDRAVQSMRENPMFKQIRTAAAALYNEAAAKLPPRSGANGKLAVRSKKYSEISRSIDLIEYAAISSDELRDNKLHVSGKTRLDATPESATWFIPPVEHALKGGVRTIFMAAQNFSEHWGTHNHFVVLERTDIARSYAVLEKSLGQFFPNLRFEISSHVLGQDVGQIPPADIGICTLWTTAYQLARYNQTKRKFYFVQDFEPAFYPAGDVYGAIEATYRFGYTCIANTKGVEEKYRAYSDDSTHFTPAVDHTIYYPDHSRNAPGNPAQIVFYGRPANSRNAFGLGALTLQHIKRKMGNGVRLVSAGAAWKESEFSLQGIVENLGLLTSLDEVAELYRQSDIGMVFMFTPHPSYQPLEYMASGCVTVTNHNAANTWLLEDGNNCLMVEPIPEVAADAVVQLLARPQEWSRLRKNGWSAVKDNSWDKEFAHIREFIMN